MASCDTLSPVAGCDMIIWPTSKNLNWRNYSRGYILLRASSDSNLAIISTYYNCQRISCMHCGKLPTPNFAP